MKIAVVTGAAGGIGRAICRRLSEAGHRVVGVDREPVSEVSWRGEARVCDIGDVAQLEDFLEELAAEIDGLDLLVNNAAIAPYRELASTTAETWDRVFAVNLRAAFLLIRGTLPLLRARDGAVVNVGSVHARATSRGVAAYASSKAGLSGLTRAAAAELAEDGIRVNAVLPGAVDTPMLRAGLERGHVPEGSGSEAKLEELGRRHPVGRVGRPEEIAAAVEFLGSEQASFLTGEELVVDGGALARLSTE